jgi:hypothetical protein
MDKAARILELEALRRTDEGKDRLVEILKQHRGLKPGMCLPLGTLLVASIIAHEFPEG